MRLRIPLAQLASVLLFAALCAVCATWALALWAPRSPVTPAGTIAQTGAPVDLRQAAALFGTSAAPQTSVADPGPSDVQVTGVIAAGPRGVALLSVNGRPAKPFAVGEAVDADTTVAAVHADAVTLSRRGQRLSAPAPKRPDLAILTSGPVPGSGASGGPAPGVPLSPPLGQAAAGTVPAAGNAAPMFPPAGMGLPAAPPTAGAARQAMPPPPPAPALAPTDPPLPVPDPPPAGAGLPGVAIRP